MNYYYHLSCVCVVVEKEPLILWVLVKLGTIKRMLMNTTSKLTQTRRWMKIVMRVRK